MLAKPELLEELTDDFEAYKCLSHTREPGRAITLQEMLAYCALFGMDDTERFVRLMQGMDRVFFEYVEKMRAKNG